ncbi:MAG: tRNA (adenosine(37)-N6)-threonylcarbamoyltransferase complex ATPase subunit type 1 TsaE [Rhodobacteraceae bacterium]|jgi:tRNA threonylcarbamoyladenosine biosynthesis protein TsaE|nr:tRNA (adenosine(37)-N6)-threonylcarbamoyltransferase complex ATPase subunit type 1 TsaE [Paracoccaceae bacterium]
MLIELPNQILNTTDETAGLAARIGAQLRIGDTLLLQGDIGAGKSFFARALIQSLQDHPEDVPSPTFTLVQTYTTNIGEVWHADLYRLNDPSEAEELGLAEAFSDAICLIEWPDRLANLVPPDAITLSFTTLANDDMRQISFSGGTQALRSRISKALL